MDEAGYPLFLALSEKGSRRITTLMLLFVKSEFSIFSVKKFKGLP